jgi:hypothetical protein
LQQTAKYFFRDNRFADQKGEITGWGMQDFAETH